MNKLNLACRWSCLILIVIGLSGCAVGKMLMSGYTPPRTIKELMTEEYGKAGLLPPELQNDKDQASRLIHVSNYKGELSERPMSADAQLMYAPTLYRPSFTHKGLEDYAAQLMMQMHKRAVGLSPDLKIGVSSFVRLDETLQTTTVFGNQLSEYMMSEMQKYGLSVIDHKLKPALTVSRQGDIAFSRDVLELSKQRLMDYVLSGTMIEKNDGIFVNARIISVYDNRVIASAHMTVPYFVVSQISSSRAAP